MSPNTKLWILKGEGKGFCAGGDVKSLYNDKQGPLFFEEEYKLDYKISNLNITYLIKYCLLIK